MLIELLMLSERLVIAEGDNQQFVMPVPAQFPNDNLFSSLSTLISSLGNCHWYFPFQGTMLFEFHGF
jgi:hypothetical protein